MDYYRSIEVETAQKHGAIADATRKSIGDFLLDGDIKRPVNVKSNNVDKKNYSPNIVSARRLIKWLECDGNELYFIFVDYRQTESGILTLQDSGLVAVEHINWDCLTIEAQGWGVIQMSKKLIINKNQDKKAFFKAMKIAYEKFMAKEAKKMLIIKNMIENF